MATKAKGVAVWSDKATKLLIHLRQEHEADFNKPSTKKKNLWEKISAKLREYGHDFTGPQTENKWKNLTKEYRKTVDTNNTSGSNRASCSYYDELNVAYGYRPNVTPVVTCSSLKPLQPPPSNPNTPISKRKRDDIDDENASIGAKTLSGLGYKGHVFWDTELFMLPPLTLTDEEADKITDLVIDLVRTHAS